MTMNAQFEIRYDELGHRTMRSPRRGVFARVASKLQFLI